MNTHSPTHTLARSNTLALIPPFPSLPFGCYTLDFDFSRHRSLKWDHVNAIGGSDWLYLFLEALMYSQFRRETARPTSRWVNILVNYRVKSMLPLQYPHNHDHVYLSCWYLFSQRDRFLSAPTWLITDIRLSTRPCDVSGPEEEITLFGIDRYFTLI